MFLHPYILKICFSFNLSILCNRLKESSPLLVGNVLKEIVEPAGAVIRCRDFTLGDPTISTLELWGAEYQESDAILIRHESIPLLKKMGDREKVPVSFVGTITGSCELCCPFEPSIERYYTYVRILTLVSNTEAFLDGNF